MMLMHSISLLLLLYLLHQRSAATLPEVELSKINTGVAHVSLGRVVF